MSEAELLNRLCDLAGIETSYWDLGGTLHQVPDRTRQYLVSAMGYEAHNLDALKASIIDLETRQWCEYLEPVYVLRQGSPACIAVTFCEDDPAQNLNWGLEYDNGLTAGGEVSIDGLDVLESRKVKERLFIRRRIYLPDDMPAGYHKLVITINGKSASTQIIATPATAYLPDVMDGHKVWGAAHQLYALRSPENWGIGDFSDLARLGKAVAGAGGAVLGLNPLHALFLSSPEQASPYAPSSRIFMNPLYIDAAAIPEFADCKAAHRALETGAFSTALKKVQKADLVDYRAVVKIKLQILRLVFACFETKPGTTGFPRFIEEGGEKLHRFALYQALEAHFSVSAHGWPPSYRDPLSKDVHKFTKENSEEIRFHLWLQWQARSQLEHAAASCREQGLAVGLYGDLAVGVDAHGADAWGGAGAYVEEATFGAPPDPFSADGQNWGMPPLDPVKLRDAAYRPFIDILRANMRYAGALRIDHVMWLQRMFWIPKGAPAADGAYIRYPVDDLMAILTLESRRNECVIIGEDLGTVPEGFAQKMQAHGILSYRLMRFERYPDGLFKRPSTYPKLSLAMFGSHDLPTIAGYWNGRDLDALGALARLDEAARRMRQRDLDMLVNALRDQQLWPETVNDADIIFAIHRFLARSGSGLMMLNLEDVLEMRKQVNMPGTYLEYPNWQHRLNADLAEIQSRLAQLGPALLQERARSEDV